MLMVVPVGETWRMRKPASWRRTIAARVTSSSETKFATVSWLIAAPASKSGVPPSECGEAWANTRRGISPAVFLRERLRLLPLPEERELRDLLERLRPGARDISGSLRQLVSRSLERPRHQGVTRASPPGGPVLPRDPRRLEGQRGHQQAHLERGLPAEPPGEHVATAPVLLERLTRVPGREVRRDQDPVRALAKAVRRHRRHAGLDRFGEAPVRGQLDAQALERAEPELPEALALDLEPVVVPIG